MPEGDYLPLEAVAAIIVVWLLLRALTGEW